MNKQWIVMLRAVVLFILASMVCACASVPKSHPRLNPTPKHFLTITGHIDTAFNNKMTLSFVQTTTTMNKKCYYTDNVLAGLKGSQSVDDVYVTKPDSQGNYKLRIPYHKYLPGKCDWQPYILEFNLDGIQGGKLESGAANYISHNPPSVNSNKFNFYCARNLEKCHQGQSDKSDVFYIVPTHSRSMSFNLHFDGG